MGKWGQLDFAELAVAMIDHLISKVKAAKETKGFADGFKIVLSQPICGCKLQELDWQLKIVWKVQVVKAAIFTPDEGISYC